MTRGSEYTPVSFVIVINDDGETATEWCVDAVVDSRDPLSWLATRVVHDGTLLDTEVLNLVSLDYLNALVEDALIDHDTLRCLRNEERWAPGDER